MLTITKKSLEIIYDKFCQAGDTERDFYEWAINYLLNLIKTDKDKITRRNKQIKELKRNLKYWEDGVIVLNEDGTVSQQKLPEK